MQLEIIVIPQLPLADEGHYVTYFDIPFVTSQEADRTWSIFCFWSFQGERGEHGPPQKGERGEPGPVGPKVRLDSVPGKLVRIYGLFKSRSVDWNLLRVSPGVGRGGWDARS